MLPLGDTLCEVLGLTDGLVDGDFDGLVLADIELLSLDDVL